MCVFGDKEIYKKKRKIIINRKEQKEIYSKLTDRETNYTERGRDRDRDRKTEKEEKKKERDRERECWEIKRDE